MFQIFLIFIFTAACNLSLLEVASAQNSTPQTLSEINYDLKSKKEALEPFDDKKVKIDLESLGLDDLDKKPGEVRAEAKPPEVKPEEKKAPEELPEEVVKPKDNPIVPNVATNPKPEKKDAVKDVPETTSEPVKKVEGGGSLNADQKKSETEPTAIFSKLQNFLRKDDPKKNTQKPGESKLANKKPSEKYINSQKKKGLKKRLEDEKRKKKNEKLRQEKLKKLQALRKQYLIKIDVNPDDNEDEDAENNEEKIVPHKKEINQFVTEELPAFPILNHYRTSENSHIPTIPTPKEKVDNLFYAISSGKVGFFNSAYKDVENPNVKNQMGDTALTCAILLQRYPIIASILTRGADPDMANGLGYTPLNIAIEMLDFKSIKLLIENKADVNYLDNFGRTYLMHAARVGFLPAVEMLVSQGVDINAMDNDGFTALSIAYRHKKEIIVKFLLKNGAKTWIEKPYDPQNQSLIKELENRWK